MAIGVWVSPQLQSRHDPILSELHLQCGCLVAVRRTPELRVVGEVEYGFAGWVWPRLGAGLHRVFIGAGGRFGEQRLLCLQERQEEKKIVHY